jgi:HSP20 family protein
MMELMKWNSMKEMFDLRSRFNTLWDDFLTPPRSTDVKEGLWSWNPTVDVYENEDAIVVKAELPGVDKDKIAVDLQDRVLTIKGERSSDREEKKDRFYRRERIHGSFERAFSLPDGVNPDAIKAEYKDGVLKIEVPKPEGAKPKRITVH